MINLKTNAPLQREPCRTHTTTLLERAMDFFLIGHQLYQTIQAICNQRIHPNLAE